MKTIIIASDHAGFNLKKAIIKKYSKKLNFKDLGTNSSIKSVNYPDYAHKVCLKVVKNKLAPPFRTVEFEIMYGKGISKLGELVDLGTEAGVIEKSGTWYSYKGEKIGQGKENAKKYLLEKKDIASALYRSILEASGLVKEKMMEGKKDENKTPDTSSNNPEQPK